ncbi:MAG: hypothetical protein ACM309_09370 [Bacillota bacterium]
MYPVTQDFVEAVQAQKRRVLARVTIDYTSPDLDQSIAAIGNEEARISWPAQTADAVAQTPHFWASLDGSWVLGDARCPAPSTEQEAALYQMGWWGSQLAGVGGSFASPYPTLTMTHYPRPVHSLRVVGDSEREEYPVDFSITLYDATDTLLHTEVVTGNAQLDWSMALPEPILGVAKQVLTITKWSHAGRQAKVIEFFTSIQQTYEGDELIGVRLLEERESSQGSLPVGNISANELSVRLANDDKRFDPDNDTSPLYGLIKPNRRVRAWLGADMGGGVEWVPLGLFWTTDWDTDDQMLEASLRALDRLERLRQTIYRTSVPAQNVTAAALAQAILEDAGLTAADYAIDAALESIVFPWAWMPLTSHREALRILAEAAMAVVYCDRDGRIRLAAGVGTGDPHPITPDDYFPPLRSPARKEQVANEIVVRTLPVAPAAEATEVCRTNTPIVVPAGSGVVVTVQYSQPPVIDAVASLVDPPAGVSITDASYYAWGADVSIANVSVEDASVTLVVTGRAFSVQGGQEVIARDEVSIEADGLIRYEFAENHLIQTPAQAQAIAEGLLASAQVARRDVEFEWRGNPALELGDPVLVTTDAAYGRQSLCAVIRQELDWSGALTARLAGRRLE